MGDDCRACFNFCWIFFDEFWFGIVLDVWILRFCLECYLKFCWLWGCDDCCEFRIIETCLLSWPSARFCHVLSWPRIWVSRVVIFGRGLVLTDCVLWFWASGYLFWWFWWGFACLWFWWDWWNVIIPFRVRFLKLWLD